MLSVSLFINKFKTEAHPSERMGQYFCNCYVRDTYPQLFHERDEERCLEMITEWLERYQYRDTLPTIPRVKTRESSLTEFLSGRQLWNANVGVS